MFGELMGRAGGICGGRGRIGLPHRTRVRPLRRELDRRGADSARARAALAARFDGSGRVSLASLGDGAMNQGARTRGAQLRRGDEAAVDLRLREQRLFRTDTDRQDGRKHGLCRPRGRHFGIAADEVDGNDPLAVEAVVAEAAARARRGAGPTFVEARTARLVGHYIGDAQTYRPGKRWTASGRTSRSRGSGRRLASDSSELAVIEAETREAIDRAVLAAREQPFPEPSTATAHVYA